MTSAEQAEQLAAIDVQIANLTQQREAIASAPVDDTPPAEPPVISDPAPALDVDGPELSLVGNASNYVDLQFTPAPGVNYVSVVTRRLGDAEWMATNITDSPVSVSPCSVSINHGYAVGEVVEFAAGQRVTQSNNQSTGPVIAVTIA